MIQTIRKFTLLAAFIAFEFPLFHMFFSPVLIVAGAARGVVTASLATYAALTVISLFLGRAFCGWACPGTAVQECCVNLGAKRIGGRTRYWTKYLMFALLGAGVAFAAVRARGFHRVDLMFGTQGGPPIRMVLLHYGAFLIIVPLAFAIGKYASCHYVCWIAPLLVCGSRLKERAGWPSLRLLARPDKCVQCEECIEACPMSLPVRDHVANREVLHDECILCGSCVSGCPTGAIRFAYGPPYLKTSSTGTW